MNRKNSKYYSKTGASGAAGPPFRPAPPTATAEGHPQQLRYDQPSGDRRGERRAETQAATDGFQIGNARGAQQARETPEGASEGVLRSVEEAAAGCRR